MGRLNAAARHALAPLFGAALLVAAVAPPALAADPSGVTFGAPEASSKYAERIEFVQPVALDRAVDRAEVRLTFADSTSPLVVEMPGLPAGDQSMRYSFDFTEGGHLYPNTPDHRPLARLRRSGGSDRHGRATGHPHLRGRSLRLERSSRETSSGSIGTRATRRSAGASSRWVRRPSARRRSCSA